MRWLGQIVWFIKSESYRSDQGSGGVVAPTPEYRQRGQVLILTAVALTVLLGAAALVTDIGMLTITRRALQNAVDAGALAGAVALPGDPAGARAAALDWTRRNGVGITSDDAIAATVTTTSVANDTINVMANRIVHYGFARIFGLISSQVRADASAINAVAGSVRSANGISVIPWAVNNDAFVSYGQLVSLQPANSNNQNGQFNFVSIDPPGGTQSYADAMANGVAGDIVVGRRYPTNAFDGGKVSQQTASALNSRINSRPNETWDAFRRGSPRVVIIPVVNGNIPNPPNPVVIETFRAFFLEQVDTKNNVIYGRFVPIIVSVGAASPQGISVPDLGVHVVKLIR